MNNSFNIFALIFVASIIIFSCKGPQGPVGPHGPAGSDAIDSMYIKELRLDLKFSASTNVDSWTASMFCYYKFDKRNYPGVDSIIFIAFPYTLDTNTYSMVKLFNWDTGEDIPNSIIQSNHLPADNFYVASVNLYKYLPDSAINIGIKMKISNKGSAYANNTYLCLYRK